ncbi:MAG: M10 family metallopeptidase C-terminal domain-containing protein, partial [Caulobacteraceae bacterium]
MASYTGSSGGDVRVGTSDADTFDMSQGGDDSVAGGGGGDSFTFGAALTAGDTVSGGAEADHLYLSGDYSAGLTFLATTLSSIEYVHLTSGVFDLTLADGNVAAGESININAVGATSLDLDASAETDAQIEVVLDGNVAASRIKGGAGQFDALSLQGGGDLTFTADTLSGIELIRAYGGFDYDLTFIDDNIGGTMNFYSYAGAGDVVRADLSAATNTRITFIMNASDDIFYGAGGNDRFTTSSPTVGADLLDGGGGDDRFEFWDAPAGTTVNGGEGFDRIYFYRFDLVTWETAQSDISNIELIETQSTNLKLVLDNAITAAGKTLEIRAESPADPTTLIVSGKAEKDGSLLISGASLEDRLSGGQDADTLNGFGGADTLSGAKGRDVIDAGAGADKIDGGKGPDQLTGGTGADGFFFGIGSRGDTVTDLEDLDTINLSKIDADKTVGGNQAFVLVGAFNGAAGEAMLDYRAAKDITRLLLDTDGDGEANITIEFTGDHTG